ncbi:MAG: NAD(P)/FAD-dependent oxidoreductase [Candidatus Heimdallarchaeota archaeon]|nr:MAG: NAD(P)/FAD-dependent oxidoreductase [Candidatus Heimdallarchaeota archaeon]
MQEYDVIIIGAGLGGLTAGAKLAKEGKTVLLVEQHHKVGGCATTFSRKIAEKKVVFEIGLHEMDGLAYEFDPKKRVFQDLGVHDNVSFARVPEFYRFTNGRVDVTVPDDISTAIRVISDAFPDEKEAIESFFYGIREIFGFLVEGNLEKLASVSQMSVGEYLDNLTTNEDLKFTLTGNLGYYHDDPYTLSIIFFAAAQNSYFSGGGHFIQGGSQTLSDYLAKVITDNGGTIVLRHLVTRIITEDGTAIGVIYVPKRHMDQQLTAKGKIILVNAALPNVINNLVPSLSDSTYQQTVNSFKIACSILSVYLAFSKPPSTLVPQHVYSTFILPENLSSLKDLYSQERSNDFSKKGFVFVDYSMIDSRLNEEDIYTGALCCVDYIDHWAALTSYEYSTKKESVAQTLIQRLNQIIPGIQDIISYSEVATPKTIVRYTQNPAGTAYGFAQTPDQIGPMRTSIRKPPIKNLYCASAWTGSGGFSGAIMAGYSGALKILKDNW